MNVAHELADRLDDVPMALIDTTGIDHDLVQILIAAGLITVKGGVMHSIYKAKSFGEFCTRIFLNCPVEMRLGQWATVLFVRKFPEVIIPADIDPFNDSEKLPQFLDFAAEYTYDL